MGEALADPTEGGEIHGDIGVFLPGCRVGNPDFRIVDVGEDPCIGRDLGGFHHWVARRTTGKHTQQQSDENRQ